MGPEEHAPLVAILDDDQSVQAALQDLVESERLPVVCFDSAHDFLESGARFKVSCLIADIRMPGMSGLELQAKLKHAGSSIPIIFITALGDIPMAVHAMREGAIDFLAKPINDVDLLKSIEKALQQDCVNRRESIERERFASRFRTLTPREREVLKLLVRGLLNKQAGFELGIKEYTVQIHRSNIMRKMEAGSFASLVSLATKFASEGLDAEQAGA
jgi:FixJ family two-component response regulator